MSSAKRYTRSEIRDALGADDEEDNMNQAGTRKASYDVQSSKPSTRVKPRLHLIQGGDIADFTKAKERCSFLRHCIDEAETLPEPHWYAAGTNVIRCRDGENLFHGISEAYPAYDEVETQRKIDHALQSTGPHTCQYIAGSLGYGPCQECEWLAYQTAPVQLGTSRFDEGLPHALSEMNLQHAVVMLNGSCRVIHLGTGPDGRVKVDFLKKDDFFNLHANWSVEVPSGKGTKSVNVAKEWFVWSGRREYQGVVFSPGKEIPGYFNLYRGMSIEPEAGDWSKFRQHIRQVIAGGDDRIFEYLLNYLARIVQDPGGDRPGVAIVLRGEQGTGKGVFVKNFAQIFKDHSLHITQSEQLTGKFNQHLVSALIVFVDEGFWAGDKAAEGVLKAIITEENFMCEAKGRDAFMIENHMNLFMASNNDWVVPAGASERRFLVLDVSNERKQDHAYFAEIQKEMDSGGREAMLHDLLNRDISQANLRAVPKTRALADQVVHSLDSIGRFWFDRLYQGRLLTYSTLPGGARGEFDFEYTEVWHDFAPVDFLYEEYTAYCKQSGLRHPVQREQLTKKIKKFCPGLTNDRRRDSGRRIRGVIFPTLEQCREEFCRVLGIHMTWDDEEEPKQKVEV